MIKVKEYINVFDGVPFYMAEATKISKKVTGITRVMALKNLKNEIEKSLKNRATFLNAVCKTAVVK